MMKSFAMPARLIDTMRRSLRISSSRVVQPPQTRAAINAVPVASCPQVKPAKPPRRAAGAVASVAGTSGSSPTFKTNCSVIGNFPLIGCLLRYQRAAPSDAEKQDTAGEEVQKDLSEFGTTQAVGRDIMVREIGRLDEELVDAGVRHKHKQTEDRSEEHTSELQSIMSISYADC